MQRIYFHLNEQLNEPTDHNPTLRKCLPNGDLVPIRIKRPSTCSSISEDEIESNCIVLPREVQKFVDEKAKICKPDSVYICDGSDDEYKWMLNGLLKAGCIQKLDHMENWY